MSNQITEVPLWKDGKKTGIQFLASWKRLEKEAPELYEPIEQHEDFICQNLDFPYRVGMSRYGLWLSRKRIQIEDFKKIGVVTGGNESTTTDKKSLPKSSENTELVVRPTLEDRVATIEKWIKKVSDSWELNSSK